ncbi:MAG: DHH family phosphoesterase [Brevinematia bacterium]
MGKSFRILKNRVLRKNLKKLHKIIEASKKVLITGHINTDGDNISSQLALASYLENINKPFDIVWSERVPESFEFIRGVEKIKVLDEKINFSEYDIVIVVDSGDLKRIGKLSEYVDGKFIVNLDHHKGNTNFGNLNIVVENASSIGELLFYFFTLNKIEISSEIAFYLYVSIVSDTGFFRFDSMHPDVHIIASKLLEKGINTYEINLCLNQSKSLAYLKYLKLVLNRLKLEMDNRVCYSYLLKEDFDENNNLETDSLVEYLGILRTVSVYFLIKEKEKGIYNISLRSKFDVDVSRIASNFGGGGHMRAAGCRVDGLSLEEAKEKLLNLIGKEL